MEDVQIVGLYWDRNEDAIAESAAKYGGYCRQIANNILDDRSDAEECVNDTWLGAWNAMPPHRPARLSTFLGKITRNLSCNKYKANNAGKRGGGQLTQALEELRECAAGPGGAPETTEDEELARLINDFLRGLPPRECNVFLRRYWYVESMEQIAGRYGMTANSVKASLFRSRTKLRRFLEKEGVAL